MHLKVCVYLEILRGEEIKEQNNVLNIWRAQMGAEPQNVTVIVMVSRIQVSKYV